VTYKKAATALVNAGLLKSNQVDQAVDALSPSSVGMTYLDWVEALVNAGLIDGANRDAAAGVMEMAGQAEAEEDSQGFEDSLEDAGIL
jgi:hypothetical protein